jgi:hypothetical protein
MKKVIFVLAAVATMMSCMTNETVNNLDITKIDFGSYVQGVSSRANENPAFTTNNIEAFDVWAFMDRPSGLVFDQERVSKNANGEWTYAKTEYWYPSHTYNFVALAPVDHSNIEITLANAPYIAPEGLGSVTFTNLDGTDDLIYAEEQVTTPDTITSMAPVGLGFRHLLSKVRFTFKNCFTGEFSALAVKDIKMHVMNKASIDLTQDTFSWVFASDAQELVLDLGNGGKGVEFAVGESVSSDNHRLTIPADNTKTYKVTFTVSTYNGDVWGADYPVEATIKDCEFMPGKQYNFKVDLTGDAMGLYPIVFGKPVIDEWVSDTNPEQDSDLNL